MIVAHLAAIIVLVSWVFLFCVLGGDIDNQNCDAHGNCHGYLPGTRTIHQYLHDNVGAYRAWHHSSIRVPTHVFIAFITLLVATAISFGPRLSENPQAAVGILKEIPFQGRLTNTDGTVVADGDYDLTFKLYTVDVGGAAVWTESHTGVNDIPAVDGVFNTLLGSITPLTPSVDFNSDTWWLGVTVESDSEMTPRVRLGAAPFAFNSDLLDGVDATGFLVLDGQAGGQTAHGGTAASENLVLRSTTHATKGNILLVDDGGNVGIGTSTPTDFILQVAGDIGPDANDIYDLGSDTLRWQDIYLGPGTLHVGTSTADEGTLAFDTTNNELEFALNGTQQLMLTSDGNAVFGNAALATSATDGFLHYPGMPGAPTGVPTAYSGRVPFAYNTTSNILYVYNVGWQAVNGAGGGATLQTAYANGNTLTTSTARDIVLTLADTGVDSDLFVNMLGTSNIIAFQDTGTAFATWSDTGVAVFKPTVNSTAAFQVQPSASAVPTLGVDTTNLRIGINVAAPIATLDITPTATSGASGTTRGWLQVRSATYTDNVTAAAGTAASFAFNAYQTPTLAATNTTVTTTNAATLYVAAQPTVGANMTITNAWALWVDSGNSRFDGNIMPGVDNTIDLGSSALRFRDIYAGTSVRVGTTPAASGMIRLPNNETITARNAGNTADIDLIKLSASNTIDLGATSSNITELSVGTINGAGAKTLKLYNPTVSPASVVSQWIEGSLSLYNSDNFGGSIATTGILRIPNNEAIVARNAAGSADVDLIKLSTSNTIDLGATSSNITELSVGTINASGAKTLKLYNPTTNAASVVSQWIEGSLSLYNSDNFGSSVASTGIIRIPNNQALVARNAADGADVNLISLSVADATTLGLTAANTLDFATGASNAADVSWNVFNIGTGQSNLRLEGYLEVHDTNALGASVATTGHIRLPNAASLSARNSGNTADISLISLTAGDDIQFGATATNAVDIAVGATQAGNITLSFANIGTGDANVDIEGSLETGGSIIADTDDTYDLGSSAIRWRDLYLGPSSLHIASTVAETVTARDWEFNILEAGGSEGDLQLFEGAQQRLSVTRSGQTEAGVSMILGTGGSDLTFNTDTDTTGFSVIRSTVGSGISFYGAADVNALTILRLNSNVGINCIDPDNDLEVGGTGVGCNTGTRSFMNAGDTAWSNSSSRAIKENFNLVDSSDILSRISAVPVYTYDFKPEFCTSEHCTDRMGLVAEDFYSVFGRGEEITINGHEVTMALWLATQELADKVKVLESAKAKSPEITKLAGTVELVDLKVADKAELSGTLVVAKAATFEDTILVKGDSILEGDLVVKQDLKIEGAILGSKSTRGYDLSVDSGEVSANIDDLELPLDTGYAVSVSPSWLTTYSISDKTNQGFTVHFGVPAPVNASFDYLIQQ